MAWGTLAVISCASIVGLIVCCIVLWISRWHATKLTETETQQIRDRLQAIERQLNEPRPTWVEVIDEVRQGKESQ
jgi:hypothetical protein